MALYDRRFDPDDVNRRQAAPHSAFESLLPFIIGAAIAAALLIAIFLPRGDVRLGDTNAGPSVKTVTTQPAPSTSPTLPTPTPATETRPTQAPIP